MINLSQLDFRKRRKLSGVLGLALDGSRLDGVVLRRTNGSLQLAQSFSVTLALDPLTAAPELVGREIRNHLDAAGVRERRCVVGLPLKWALATHTKIPDLPEADVANFLQIEAERGFASDVATLVVAASRCETSAGEKHAMLVGVPRNHVAALEQVLRAAKLQPISFTLGLTALQNPRAENSAGVLALTVGESHVGLQVTAGGGVAALRALDGALEIEGGQRKLVADLVAREARITLGQLPAELRDAVRRIRIFGPRDLAQQLADEMEIRFEPLGLKVEVVIAYAAGEFGVQLPVAAAVSPAFSLAANRLVERAAEFELLPPKVTAWQLAVERYASGKLKSVGVTAGAVVAVILLAFLVQQIQLWRLRSQWSKMAVQVKELETTQDQIRHYRPWFDETVRGLTILRSLTAAFPENGTVTLKTVEIRDLNVVSCTGTAQDMQALLRVTEKLTATPGVSEVHRAVRGKVPMLFTFDFHWSEGAQHGN